MALDYFIIFANSLFAGTVSVVLTQVIFFIIARLFNYDFVFPVETGRNMLDISEDFYSNTYAGIRGFLIHIGLGLLIMFAYSFIFVNLIGIFLYMGPYTYATTSTAFFENIFWLLIFVFLIYVVYFVRDNNLDKFSVFLFLYLLTMTIIMGMLFGSYLFGNPGMITFR